MMEDDGRGLPQEHGVTRRDAIRRGAIVGGTVLWATPIVQSLTPAAHAQAQTRCGCCYCWDGDKSNPTRDTCNDNGQTGTRSTAERCAAFCADAGEHGTAFQNSEWCAEFAGGCTCRQFGDSGVGPGENGCACA